MECRHSTINAARANFARYHGIPLERVSVKDVVNASGGVAAWMQRPPSSAAASSAAVAASSVAAALAAAAPPPSAPPPPCEGGGRAALPPPPSCQPPSAASAALGGGAAEKGASAKEKADDAAPAASVPASSAPEGRAALPPLPCRPPTAPGAEASVAAVAGAAAAATAGPAVAGGAAAPTTRPGGGSKQVAFRPPLGDITNAAAGEPQKSSQLARAESSTGAAPPASVAAVPTPGRALLRSRSKRVPLKDITNNGAAKESKAEAECEAGAKAEVEDRAEADAAGDKEAEADKKEEAAEQKEAAVPLPEAVLFAEYGLREMRHMVQREADGAPRPDYMRGQPDVNSEMRAILNDWLVDVHRKFEHRKESLFLAVQVLDRFLCVAKVKRQRLQLVGATAALIAAKFEEVEPMEVADLVFVTDKAYSKDDIVDMEGSVLRALGFKLAAPTAAHFLRHLHSALRKSSAPVEGEDPIHPELTDGQPVKRIDRPSEQLAWFLLELTLLDIRSLNRAPSVLAAASVLLSNRLLGEAEPWPMLMEQLSGYSEASLSEPCEEINKLLQAAPNSPFTGVRRRYPQVEALGLRRQA